VSGFGIANGVISAALVAVAWGWRTPLPRTLGWWLHLAACLGITALTAALVFTPYLQPYIQPYYLLPPLAWAAMRFAWGGTAAATGIIALAATWGVNPFGLRVNDPLVADFLLQQGLLVAGGFGIVLAFAMSQQQQALERLREVMATLDLGVFMNRELAGKILYWSRGAELLYGWTADEAVGRISHELLQTKHPIPLAAIEKIIDEQGEWRGDLRHITKGGQLLIVAAHKFRRLRKNGLIPVLLEALTDVTAERRDQEALAELNRSLETRVEREVAARAKAVERMRQAAHFQALGRIASGVAHEFNNILQVIIGSVTLIEADAENAVRVRRMAVLAHDAADRGAIVTSRLLGFARKSPFRLEPIDLVATLTALADVLTLTLGNSGSNSITFAINLAPTLPTPSLDRTELQVALLNLATNARDAMPQGGVLTITAAGVVFAGEDNPEHLPPGRYVAIAIADTGTGMDEATLERAAEPFFTTKDIGKGTGLGLSMVKGFTEQSGGAMTLASTPGRGTVVTLWLPIKDT
jgi:PAS domain S-box-containing protein